MRTEIVELPPATPGTYRRLKIHRFGREGARPKAYLQAALHADELPGALVLHKLVEQMQADEHTVAGELIVVPLANPIGLAQHIMGYSLGRSDLAQMSNFNRSWPDFSTALAERLLGALDANADANTELARGVLRELAQDMPVGNENAFLRRTLAMLTVDADIVLDLHCASEAVPHIFLGTPLWPAASDLAAELESEATLLAEVSGGNPFDEAFSSPWWELRRRFPDGSFPPGGGCLSATVELRGQADLGHEIASRDATALRRFLMRRRVLTGDPGPLPALLAEATPLEGVVIVRAPITGLIDYRVKPGERVAAGQPVAVLIDPIAGEGTGISVEVAAPAAGVVFAREAARLARAGAWIAMIAGAEPLARRGAGLLLD